MKNKELSIEEELRDVMDAAKEAAEVEMEEALVEEPVEEAVEDVEELALEEKEETQEKVVIDPPPVSLSPAAKAKWDKLDPDIRAEWKKREDDMHKAMTAQDGDLAVGRKIKEIAAPYEAIIRAEGGTVESAFKELLNASYVMRTGSPQQKAQVLLEAAQQFKVDLRPYLGGQGQQPNPVAALQQEMAYLRQQIVDPNKLKTQLQEEIENDKLSNEIQAFAANPANIHFQEVRHIMGSLLESGKAGNLQEAYDSAIWSIPSIRAELEAKAEAAKAEKRKAEMAAKKKAAASVSGSAGIASPNANAPQQTLEEALFEQLREQRGQI